MTKSKKCRCNRREPWDFYYEHPVLSFFMFIVFPPIILIPFFVWLVLVNLIDE